MAEGLSNQPQTEPQVIHWFNQYELDLNGVPLPEDQQYGGGGPMSADYKEIMRLYASMGVHEPWTNEGQAGTWGVVLVSPSQRATYIDPTKKFRKE